jgi:predicted nuclease with TOPRIM domain
MKAQLALKNKEISHLLDEMHKLRNENRDRVSKLEDIYSKEAELLNEQLAAAKKENHELKRRLHELRDQMEDTDKENRLQNELKNEENLQLRESN